MQLLWTKSRENRVICLLNCLMDNHALFHKELWDWLLKMADEDPLGDLMKSAIEEVNNRLKSVESSEIEEETFRVTLPKGYTYNIEELSGDEGKFNAHFVADGITKVNIKQWVAEYEAINGATVKIKASKKLSNEYVLRHYYRCHHNTRHSPSKGGFPLSRNFYRAYVIRT